MLRSGETGLAARLAKAPAEMEIPLAKILLVKGDAAGLSLTVSPFIDEGHFSNE